MWFLKLLKCYCWLDLGMGYNELRFTWAFLGGTPLGGLVGGGPRG